MTTDDVINFKIYPQSSSKAMADSGIKEDHDTKMWIHQEEKELFKSNKKQFS